MSGIKTEPKTNISPLLSLTLAHMEANTTRNNRDMFNTSKVQLTSFVNAPIKNNRSLNHPLSSMRYNTAVRVPIKLRCMRGTKVIIQVLVL